VYADDITVLSEKHCGLQKWLDIILCSAFGQEWDISFNPAKSQLLFLGGDNPSVNCLKLSGKSI